MDSLLPTQVSNSGYSKLSGNINPILYGLESSVSKSIICHKGEKTKCVSSKLSSDYVSIKTHTTKIQAKSRYEVSCQQPEVHLLVIRNT